MSSKHSSYLTLLDFGTAAAAISLKAGLQHNQVYGESSFLGHCIRLGVINYASIMLVPGCSLSNHILSESAIDNRYT